MTTRADHLIPRAWRWRVAARRHPDGRIELFHPPTGARLAWVVPEVAHLVPSPRCRDSWVVADANMVTRWYTLEDAVLYAAQPRGRWDRPWPFKMAQFAGDRVRQPWTFLPVIAALAVVAYGVHVAPVWLAVPAGLGADWVIGCVIPGTPEPDHALSDPGEVDGWPDDPRWRALDDSVVWAPGYRETCPQCEGSGTDACGLLPAPCDVCGGEGTTP